MRSVATVSTNAEREHDSGQVWQRRREADYGVPADADKVIARRAATPACRPIVDPAFGGFVQEALMESLCLSSSQVRASTPEDSLPLARSWMVHGNQRHAIPSLEEDGVVGRASQYPPELGEQAVRMVD